jgi:hypothetical protein
LFLGWSVCGIVVVVADRVVCASLSLVTVGWSGCCCCHVYIGVPPHSMVSSFNRYLRMKNRICVHCIRSFRGGLVVVVVMSISASRPTQWFLVSIDTYA